MRRAIITLCIILCLVSPVCMLESGASQKTFYVTINAGPYDRRETVVTFALPNDLKGIDYGLRDELDRAIPLQVDANRQAAFILKELKANTAKKYRLEELKTRSSSVIDGVDTVQGRDSLTINSAGRQVLVYQAQPVELPGADIKPIFRRGGYIHPVYTPSGRIVTDDYPADHRHHHGIWFAWTKTVFEGRHPDFWNMGDGTGKVEFVAIDKTWTGSVHAGFKSRHRYVDLSAPEAKTVLNEEWEVIVYKTVQRQKPYSIFDLISTQECATSSPLVLPEYRYGGIGFRGHRDWLDKSNCFFLTSNGENRSNGHGSRARWCHIGGKVDGHLAGITILDHPNNFRAPQPMRINPDQPFFCYAPSQMGQFEITPGKPYVSRYRFIVYDGPPDKKEMDWLWADFASPPLVTISLQ